MEETKPYMFEMTRGQVRGLQSFFLQVRKSQNYWSQFSHQKKKEKVN